MPKFPTPKFPTLPKPPSITLPRPPWEQKPSTVPTVPGVAGGVVTASVAGWNLVEYSDVATKAKVRFSSKPVVVALAEVRFGDILAVPTRTIPALPLTIYRCTRDVGWWILASQCGWMKIAINPDYVPDWFLPYIPDLLKPPDQCPQGHGSGSIERIDDFGAGLQGLSIYWTRALIDWKFGFDVLGFWIGLDLNWIRDALLKALYFAYYGIGQAMGYIAAQFIVITQLISISVNAALNDVLPTFWKTTGLPSGQLVTPINTRNVTETSFEYYALSEGQVTHYIALGPP